MNLREQKLIKYGLLVLEGLCFANELHHEVESELGGTPDPDEVRKLMEKIDSSPIEVSLHDLPEHLCNAIASRRWEVWESDPWEYNIGESEDDSVIGSWIGYDLVREIDTWLVDRGIVYAVFS